MASNNQTGGLFGGQASGQGLFGGNQTQNQQPGQGTQQQSSLFGGLQQGQNNQQTNSNQNLFAASNQQKGQGLFGQAQQPNQQQTNNQSLGLFGQQNKQNETPNPPIQTQANMFQNIQNQQQNTQQQAQNQGQQQQQQQQPQGGPGIFGTGGGLFGSNQNQGQNNNQNQQQPPKANNSLFGGDKSTQAAHQNAGNLFNQGAGNALNANKPSTTGGLFGSSQGDQNKAPTSATNIGGGTSGLFSQPQQNTQTTQQNQPQQQPTPNVSLLGQPQQQPNNTAPKEETKSVTSGLNLLGQATQNQAPKQPTQIGGGLFPQITQQPQNNTQATTPAATSTNSLFGNITNNAQAGGASTNQQAQPAAAAKETTQPLFGQSNQQPKTATTQPAQQTQGGGLFGAKLDNQNATGGLNLNTNTGANKEPLLGGGLPKPEGLNLGGGQKNLLAGISGPTTTTADATNKPAQPSILTGQPQAGTGILGGQPKVTINPQIQVGAAAGATSQPVAGGQPGGLLGQIPAPKKTHQPISQATGPDERLEMDTNSAKNLNGSLHMFCQNIHKYKPEHVKKFFQNPEILQKLIQGLQIYKGEQNNNDWDRIKQEAKDGKTPLKFWSERLSKYKYQYLIVMFIEDIAEYLQIKPMDCYHMFDVFLSHESKLVDYFFNPSSNEPCIEFFYEQQAISFEANNVAVRKDSPFVINLKTSFMKDIYFHERNCILASLRLLLLFTEDQHNYDVVKDVVSGLLKDKKLEESLWNQYNNVQNAQNELSAEDSELFQLQKQFENDQIIKLLFIITQKNQSKIPLKDYLEKFNSQNFMGNLQNLQPHNENTFENKNKINELSTVVGDSCLMLIFAKIKEIHTKKNQDQLNEFEKIFKQSQNSNQRSQQMNVLKLYYDSISQDQLIVEFYEQIEYLYKTIVRILNYKNLGVLKTKWQEIFFDMLLKIIQGIHSNDFEDELDEQQSAFISECICIAFSKTIHKNPKLIDLFWEKLESREQIKYFQYIFSSPISIYKVMKSALGMSSDPKSRHVIIFLTTLSNFNWINFNQIADTQQNLDTTSILKLRLIYKLIITDPKCINLLQYVFYFSDLSQNTYDQYINDCTGDEVIKFVIKSFALYNDLRSYAYQNFFAGLKALNVLLNNHQYQTQQILQIEEYQDLLFKEYRRLAIQNDVTATEYRLKCKREILNILYTILKDFEEPLLAFSQIKGMERNTEYDSPLLAHLFLFFTSFIEDWEQNQGALYLKHKWKIGSLIMKITDICLNRLSMNVYKKQDFRPVQSDSYTSFFLHNFLCNQLKKIRVDEMIIKVLEVAANQSSISNNKISNKTLKLNNKYWQTYIMNTSNKFKEHQVEHIKNQVNLRNLIVDTLKVLETTMQLIEQKIQIRKQDFEYRFLQKSMLLDEIPILDFFERIICKSDCIFHYKQEYYIDTSLNSIKINILYAISSYINFENHFYSSQDEVNPTLPFYIYNFLESEGNLINQLADTHYLLDYNTIRNPLNNARLPNGTYCELISSLSLRILTQIMLTWEAQQSIRKPILVDFLSNMNMENYWEKLNYSSINTQLTNFIIEMFNILKLNEYDLNSDSDSLRKNISDNSCAVIDFMLTALYTQPLFMNLILKPDNLNRKKKDNDLKIRFKRFFESNVCTYDIRLLNKYLNLLVEIFKRDQMYPSFCQEFRQDTQYIFEKITKVVVQNFKPYEIDQLVERDLYFLNSPKEPNIPFFEFQKYKLSQLLREHIKQTELYQQMICLHSFQILIDLISKEYLSNKCKSVQSIQNSLKAIFENKQINHIMNSLSKFAPSYSLDLWPVPQQIQTKMNIENEEQSKGKIFQQSFFYLLETNQYSYGRGYAMDASEIIFNKVDAERPQDYLSRAKYVLFKLIEFRQKSIKWSIEEIKLRTFDSWIRLFCLVTSSGVEGYAMSTVQSSISNFTLKQLREKKILLEHDQICLLYPNYEIEFVSGFVNIFCASNSQCVGLFSNLQSEVMKQILQDLKKGYFGVLFDQKLKFLLYILFSLRHLQDLDYHSKESENKNKQINNNLIGKSSQNQEAQHSFSDSYKKEEAEDLLKVMTQILEEAVHRGSRVQICDFIQCLFLQLQVMEVLYLQNFENNKNKFIINENLNPYFTKIIGILMNLAAQNVDGLPILISSLNSVLNICPQYFILQFKYQVKALEFLINKIFYEKNETAQIFVSIINLLTDIAKYPDGALLLSEANIVSMICNTPIFKNIENEPFYWQNGERNLLHSFWCWSLNFFKEYVISLPSDLENTTSSFQFLQTYFNRIAKILSIPQVLQNTASTISSNKMINTEQEKLSLAYMEEIELILELLSVYFCQANIFKRKMSNDFEQILQFLTHCTIFLFKQGLLIQSVFMPVSKMEKKLSQIYDVYQVTSSDYPHLFTSTLTPSHTPNKQELEAQISTTHSAIGDTKNKNYNLFIIQVELHYQNILFSLFSCISDGLQESSLLQLFQYSSNSFSDNMINHESKQVYSVNYWQSFANSLLDCLKFVENALNKWDNKKNKNVKMDDQLVKLRALTHSVEYNLCCYGFGSQTSLINNAKTIIQTSQYSLQNIIDSAIKHFQMLNEFKQWFGHSIKDSLTDLQNKLNSKLDGLKKLDCEDIQLKKQIEESIQLFQKLSVAQDRY